MKEPLILTVTPRGKPGIYVGKVEGTAFSVRATRHPLVDTARSLLLVGAAPETVLIMRNSGSSIDRVRGQIGTILRKIGKQAPKWPIRRIADRPVPKRGPRGRSAIRNFEEFDT